MAVYGVAQGGDADSRLFRSAEKKATQVKESHCANLEVHHKNVNLAASLWDLTVQGFLLVCWSVLWSWGALWIRWRHPEGPLLSEPKWLRSASEHFLNWWDLEHVHRRGQKAGAAPKRQAGPALWGAWLLEAPEDRCPNAELRAGGLHLKERSQVCVRR